MSKRTGNRRKQQLAAARLLKQMNGTGNSTHCNMHNHILFVLAEQTDPLSGRGDLGGDCMMSVSHRQGNKNKENILFPK